MYREKYEKWLSSDTISEDLKEELRAINGDKKEIEDRFYKELDFGTGGLRGIIGAGTNRLNVTTVGKATQGFANFLNNEYKENISVAIAYDSRNKSDVFSKAAALNLAANGIKVYLFESLRPTPLLSFAVRYLKCNGGIVLTASHNPKIYNGYKAYDENGCQLTDEPAGKVITYVNNIEDYNDIKTMSEEAAIEAGLLVYIGEEVDAAFMTELKKVTIREELVKEYAKDLNIVYTPIHGSGNVPVRRILSELGYENVNVVKEQELPDGEFPTAPYPNPEDPKVFELALKLSEEVGADVIFGTDPDCDRIGVVVKDNSGEYKVLSGNQTGILLTHYVISSLKEMNRLPKNGAVTKTIVTTEAVRKITDEYGVKLFDLLTGFKYIGEMMTEFEKTNEYEYLLGFEESYGYLIGTQARDKDAVVAAQMIAEMTLYYKKQGKTLYEALVDLYDKYGYFKETLVSVTLEGKEGQEKIGACIEALRNTTISEVAGVKIVTAFDYKLSKELNNLTAEQKNIDLPKSNVLKYVLEDDSWFVVRPSGTEPKMKVYLSVKGSSLEDAEAKSAQFEKDVMSIINEKLN
ncbi:phospho-sugar mutase [uncultured Clostridium sp.]|jgi:phosphoglucomutase|uniref:phospho-sugar mutase n=1 Tax=uncultured Clostridium sp. TaxID=59620 RepID=UPI002632B0E9|nr:phospho-sugar mutase [uncultured Clostridium sp.]